MRKQQKELMKEYVTIIENSTEKEDAMYQIVKREKRTIPSIIEMIFSILIFIGFVYAFSIGAFQTNNIHADYCNGKIISVNGEPSNKTLEDYGFTRNGVVPISNLPGNLTNGVN